MSIRHNLTHPILLSSIAFIFCALFLTHSALGAPIGFRTFSASASLGASDNIFQEPDGEENRDFILDSGISIGIGGVSRNYELDLTYNAFIEYFPLTERVRFVNDLDAYFAYLNPISSKATFSIVIQDILQQQPEFLRGTTAINNLTTVNTLLVTPSFTYLINNNNTLTTVLNVTRTDSISGEREDSTDFGIAQSLNHRFANPKLAAALQLFANYRQSSDFQDRVNEGATLTLTYLANPLTSLYAGAGYERVDLLDTDTSAQGIIAQAGITRIFSRVSSGSLTYSRRFSTDVDLGDPFIFDRVTALITRRFTRDINSSLSAYYERRDFKESQIENENRYGVNGALNKQISGNLFGSLRGFAGVFDFFDRQDEEIRLGGVLTYQISPRWFISADYSHLRRFSDEAIFEFSENIGFVTLRYATGRLAGLPFQSLGEVKSPNPATPLNRSNAPFDPGFPTRVPVFAPGGEGSPEAQ
ncbi:MAG: hypothetical protein ACT4NX_02780 [Deltaproteobacteria bacterium]